MVTFIGIVRRQKSAFLEEGYGIISSKEITPLIGKKCKITVTEVKR